MALEEVGNVPGQQQGSGAEVGMQQAGREHAGRQSRDTLEAGRQQLGWQEEVSLQPIRSQNSDTLQATQHTHVPIIIGTITVEAPTKALHTAPQVSAYPAVSQRARICPSSPYFPRGIAALILEFLRASPSEHLPFPNSPSLLAVGPCDE